MRRLEVTFSGYWYTALTIALGVVALVSGNNVLYLIESLLLSGMIFSGVLSERTIVALEIDVVQAPAFANTKSEDVIRIKNRRKTPVFCVEVGEWKNGKFVATAFFPRIPGGQEISVKSQIAYGARGRHSWDAVAIATSYPFGLARKVRFASDSGERFVWPQPVRSERGESVEGGRGSLMGLDHEYSEGEIRPYTFEDDCRDIVWTLSEKGSGPLVRARKSKRAQPRAVLDLRSEAGGDFEKLVSRTAYFFHGRDSVSESLTLIDHSGSRTFYGKIPSLNQLSIVQAAGNRAGEKSG